MNKWIAEFELEDGDTMPEHMDLNYMGAKIDFHCRPMWIPVSERLPDDDDRVLTYDTDGDINIMWFDGRDEDGKDVWKDDYSIEWCDIVAWQPLPEPWKGADDE